MAVDLKEIKNFLIQLDRKNIDLDRAVARKTFDSSYKEKAKTLLVNYRKQIYEALKDYVSIKERYDMTVAALDEADDRIAALERRVRKLTENAVETNQVAQASASGLSREVRL